MQRLKRRAGIKGPGTGRLTSDKEIEQKTAVNLPIYDEYPIEPHANSHLPIDGSDAISSGTPASLGLASSKGVTNAFALADHIHVARIVPNDGEPVAEEQGQMIYDSSVSLVKYYIGAAWHRLGPLTVDALTPKANFPASNVVKLRFPAINLTYNAGYIDVAIPASLVWAATTPYTTFDGYAGSASEYASANHTHALQVYSPTDYDYLVSNQNITNYKSIIYSHVTSSIWGYQRYGWNPASFNALRGDSSGYDSDLTNGIEDLYVLDRYRWIVCEDHGKIQFTTTGGALWKQITPSDPSGTNITLYYAYQIDKNRAIAIGYTRVVDTNIQRAFCTTDNWATYTVVDMVDTFVDTRGISFGNTLSSDEEDKKVGWLIRAYNSTYPLNLWKTSDYGFTWTSEALPIGPNTSLNAVFTISAYKAVLGTDKGQLYYTTNGTTWNLATFNNPLEAPTTSGICLRIQFVTPLIGFAAFRDASYHAKIYKSIDAGATWDRVSDTVRTFETQISDMWVENSTGTMWICYNRGISYTTNYGVTQTAQTIRGATTYPYIQFKYIKFCGDIGIAKEQFGGLYITPYRGWDHIYSSSDIDINNQISNLSDAIASIPAGVETDPLSLHLDQTIQQSIINGALWCEGTVGATPTSGAGTRLMWIPEKAAFRAGVVVGTEWDDADIGYGSVAFSEGQAAGINSVAFNSGAATGDYSFACGMAAWASGVKTIAMGESTNAGAEGSIVIGEGSNIAPGAIFSVALGYSNMIEETALYSLCGGSGNMIRGESATCFGYQNVIGFAPNLGNYSLCAGGYNYVAGDYAVCGGYFNRVDGDYQTVFGKYNEPLGDTIALIIGNGASADALSNALTLSFTGDLTIAGNYSGGNVTSGADPGHTHSLYGLLAGNNIWTGTNNFKKTSATAVVIEQDDGTDLFTFDTSTRFLKLTGVSSISITGTSTDNWTPLTITPIIGGSGTASNVLSYALNGSLSHRYTSTLTTGSASMGLVGLNFSATAENTFNGDANGTSYPSGIYMVATNNSIYNAGGNDIQGARGAVIISTINSAVNKTGGTLLTECIGTTIESNLLEGYSDVIGGNQYSGARTGDLYGLKIKTQLYLQNDYQSDFRPVHRGIYSLIQIDDYYSQTDFTAVAFYGDYSSPDTSIVPDDLYCFYNNMVGSKNLLGKDSVKTVFGTGEDASIYYNGTDLVINPKEVGSGKLDVIGIIQSDGYNSADGTAGLTATKTFTDDTGRTIIFTIKNGLITDVTGTGVT